MHYPFFICLEGLYFKKTLVNFHYQSRNIIGSPKRLYQVYYFFKSENLKKKKILILESTLPLWKEKLIAQCLPGVDYRLICRVLMLLP